jgi:predicted neutral ceramidase superfamily lipid hydrolase
VSWNQLVSRRSYLISIFPLPINVVLSVFLIAYLIVTSTGEWKAAVVGPAIGGPLSLAIIGLIVMPNIQINRRILINRMIFASNLGLGSYVIETLVFSLLGLSDRRMAQGVVSIAIGAALCFLVIRSLCYTNGLLSIGIVITAMSPAMTHLLGDLLFIIRAPQVSSLPLYLALALGVSSSLLIIIAMYLVIKRGRETIGSDPTSVLSALLEAWRARDVRPIESWLEGRRTSALVKSHILRFLDRHTNTQTALWVVLGVHPGPFSPLGSYRITEQLYAHLKQSCGNIPIFVFHGPSSHELDLISNEEVRKFLDSFTHACVPLKSNHLYETSLHVGSEYDAYPLVLHLDRNVILLFTGRAGDPETDDIDQEMAYAIERVVTRYDSSSCIIIDAHNGITSIQSDLNSNAFQNLEFIVSDLRTQNLHQLQAGFFQIEGEEVASIPEVGNAGLAFAYLKVGSAEIGIVLADANNINPSCLGTLTEICGQQVGHKVLFCTTDSHVKANHITSRHAYIKLGDLTDPLRLAPIIIRGLLMAKTRSADVSIRIDECVSRVAVFGKDLLNSIACLVTYAQQTVPRLLTLSLLLHLLALSLLIV